MKTSTLVQEVREKRNFTQEELAKLLGVGQSVISRYESGIITPPGDIVLKLQELLTSQSQAANE